MKIGIICAAEKELAPFLAQIEGIKTSEKAMLQFYEGQIHGTEVAAVVSGGLQSQCGGSPRRF